jgi:universal stress protein A
MKKIKNILLPTDLSEASLSAAEYAFDLAVKYNARVHILHVLEKTPPILTIRSLDLSEEKIVKSIEKEAKESLKKIIERIADEESDIVSAIVKGIDHEEIVKYSRDQKIDMIVIATHGRTGIMYTLLGSVAEKVIRYSKCPVLVITPPKAAKVPK